MQDAKHLRYLARRCCALEKAAVDPEIIEQLRIWTIELVEEAAYAESRAVNDKKDESIVSVCEGIWAVAFNPRQRPLSKWRKVFPPRGST